MRNPLSVTESRMLMLDERITALGRAYSGVLDSVSSHLRECSYKLGALNPVNVLSRGYSVAKAKNGVIKQKSDISSGEEFTLTVSDGDIECYAK